MAEQTNGASDLTFDESLRRIAASWDGWVAALKGIPEDRMTEPGVCGAWSVKDLIGHVASWDADALADVERIMTGAPEQPQDVQARNEASAAANATRSLEDLRTELARNHEAVVVALRGLAADDPRTLAICRAIAEDTWEHYDDHAAQVRAWRAREGI